MIGPVVIDEVVLPITGVQLTAGRLRITAFARGPLPRIRVAKYAVHGNDGVVVCRSTRDGDDYVGPIDAKDTMSITLELEVVGRTSNPVGPVRVNRRR